MSGALKCPLCASPLTEVGKKGKKMRCEACRSVFDTSQLHAFYGIDVPNEALPNAHEYETAHMHAIEMEHRRQQAEKPSGKQAAKSQGAVVPAVSPETAEPPVQTPERHDAQQTEPTKKKTRYAVIVWAVIVALCLLPWLSDLLSGLGDAVSDAIGHDSEKPSAAETRWTSTSSSTETRWTGTSASSSSKSASSADFKPVGPDMGISMNAQIGNDPQRGDVLVVEYTWKNVDGYSTSFGIAVRDRVKLNETTLSWAYPADGVAGYDSTSRDVQVEPGESGKATIAYSLPTGAAEGVVTVSAMAWKDELAMDDPPTATQTFEITA